MSKRLTSTVLLLLIGVGFGIFSISMLHNAHTTDDKILGVLYFIPSLAAFVALLMLPFKPTKE